MSCFPPSLTRMNRCNHGESFDPNKGSNVEVSRKRWFGNAELCTMWCKLGLKSNSGTRLLLYDSQQELRARYIVDYSCDTSLHDEENTPGDTYIVCQRALGSDCDKPSKVSFFLSSLCILLMYCSGPIQHTILLFIPKDGMAGCDA